MAPAPQSLTVVSGLSHFPQLLLAVSIAFLLLLAPLVIVCAFCRRLSGRVRQRIRGRKEQFVVTIKKRNVPVQPKDNPNTTNANGVIEKTIDWPTEKVAHESQTARPIPSIPLISLVAIEVGDDDSLYEVVRDVQVNPWTSEQVSPGQQNMDHTTPYEEMPSADPRGLDGCNKENKESVEGPTQPPIYAKLVKPRNKECQSQIQEKPEAKDEAEVDKPPPVPDKHLDDEESAQ
uniref:uncharacterized protein n=1 Tax=Pristiophorus japonicus TaxID=55135 RepID=UPI00398F1FB8